MQNRSIQAGSTSNTSTVIRIMNQISMVPQTAIDFAASGLILRYQRDGAIATSIAPAAISFLTSSYNSGGIEHIGDGYYRIDVPDAAFAVATGVNGVLVTGTGTGLFVQGAYITLTQTNPVTGAPKTTPEKY